MTQLSEETSQLFSRLETATAGADEKSRQLAVEAFWRKFWASVKRSDLGGVRWLSKLAVIGIPEKNGSNTTSGSPPNTQGVLSVGGRYAVALNGFGKPTLASMTRGDIWTFEVVDTYSSGYRGEERTEDWSYGNWSRLWASATWQRSLGRITCSVPDHIATRDVELADGRDKIHHMTRAAELLIEAANTNAPIPVEQA